MDSGIDFSAGGYHGDVIEEAFKDFTAANLPFWWHFREVLRASDAAAQHWVRHNGTSLADSEQRELVALSLLNYAVYTGICEALSFFQEMDQVLAKRDLPQRKLFLVRRSWKALYSSLYGSFNALANIVYILVGIKSPFGERPSLIWNYTPAQAIKLVSGRGLVKLTEPMERCKQRLEIRDQLDHYWLIWHSITPSGFMIDRDFVKGRVPLQPSVEAIPSVDAVRLAQEHIEGCSQDYNLVYHELSLSGGSLDQFLAAKGWKVIYSDYGPPHNGKRPQP